MESIISKFNRASEKIYKNFKNKNIEDGKITNSNLKTSSDDKIIDVKNHNINSHLKKNKKNQFNDFSDDEYNEDDLYLPIKYREKDNNMSFFVYKGLKINDRYDVIDKIGRGVYSDVVKVFDNKHKTYCALKIFKRKKNIINSYYLEIELLNILRSQNKNVGQMLKFFHFERFNFISLKYYGENLYNGMMKKYKYGFPIEYLEKYKNDLLIGLTFIHSKGIIHRDLKPENIVFEKVNDINSSLVIIDFSLSINTNSTKADTFSYYIQSRYYRAPEVIFNLSKSYCIDIWSLGCILFELFKGEPLFSGKNNVNMIQLFYTKIGKVPEFYEESDCYNLYYFEDQLYYKIGPKGQLYRENEDDLDVYLNTYFNHVMNSIDKKKYASYFNLIKKCITYNYKERNNLEELIKDSDKADNEDVEEDIEEDKEEEDNYKK